MTINKPNGETPDPYLDTPTLQAAIATARGRFYAVSPRKESGTATVEQMYADDPYTSLPEDYTDSLSGTATDNSEEEVKLAV